MKDTIFREDLEDEERRRVVAMDVEEPSPPPLLPIEGAALSTIHVTPEDGFSYASFEAVGYDLEAVKLSTMIERALGCFEPSEFSIAVHADVAGKLLDQNCSLDVKGYCLGEKSVEEFGVGCGSVIYQKFCGAAFTCCGSPKSVLQSCWKQEDKEEKQ
ncbi:S-adenosylmethionine decarboxylase proenzyme-like [Ipomoea triloba]|uniref:S-adenosylmethionine decarboxylase proenzyme-like n=1 Tax=Ipomoea triloba TaxID=35885 RepID=UPI00125CE484|nr:S-adenosylmethionine decarboxylase proenzyme-like [Ipomoea triloba]